MVHYPKCDALIEAIGEIKYVIFDDEDGNRGFTRQQVVACNNCGAAIGVNGFEGFDRQRQKRKETILRTTGEEKVVTSLWRCQICSGSEATDVESARESALQHHEGINHIVEITVFEE